MASSSIDANLLSPGSPSVPAPNSISSPGPSTSLTSTTYPSQALAALETYKKKDSTKVVVRFKAIGNAPIMKNNYFRITAFNRFQAVIQFLRKELGWKQSDALVSRRIRCHIASSDEEADCIFSIFPQFLYINSSFSPAPDDSVGNLFRVSAVRLVRAIYLYPDQLNLAPNSFFLVFWNRGASNRQLLNTSCLGLSFSSTICYNYCTISPTFKIL